ncbi:MAG TPA: FtsQ-type POTRA domain-containing protein [Gemmatimonadales bacterium]|nr:FtsQ-type POTRA domain-containing protein [Gemmatimonadales bacterium]
MSGVRSAWGGERRARVLWGAGIVAVVVAGWLVAPRLLRRVTFFHVRQIELVGVRYLSPDAVITALRLRPDASVFDETAPLAARVRELRGIADARVERRLPAALQVIVREVEPVAFVAGAGGRGLLPIDATGRPLPYDPSRATLDLPVAATADSGMAGLLALVRSVDPTLYQDVTAARRFGRGDVELDLGPRRVLLTRDAGPEVIRAVVVVSQDLAAKGRSYAELDARFAGQVVVRRAPTRSTLGGGA